MKAVATTTVTGSKTAAASLAKALAAVFVTAALLASLIGCGGTANAGASSAGEYTASAPSTRYVGIVLDGTGSTDPSFAGDMSQLLGNQVSNHIPALPVELKGGVPGRDGLAIYVYMVGSDPMTYKSQDYYEIIVNGYPTLPPRPTNTESETYSEDIAKWSTFRDEVWRPQYDTALQSKDDALTILSTIELYDDQWSGVCATTTALARVLPDGSSVLVCSDLENNRDVVYDDTLTGSTVHIIKPYTSGDMDYQHQLETSYKEYLINMGVSESSISVYAPEQATTAFAVAFGQ